MYKTDNPVLEAQRKFTRAARAERALRRRIEDVEWELNELQPALKKIALLVGQGVELNFDLIADGGVFAAFKQLTINASSEA